MGSIQDIDRDIRINFNKRTKMMNMKANLLVDIINSNKSTQLSLSKIREIYYQKDNSICFSLETLRKFLRNKLRCTFRRLKLRNKEVYQKNYPFIQSVFLRKIIEIVLNKEDIIYIDESGFTNPKYKFRNWTLSPYEYDQSFPKRLKRINLISAMGPKELLLSKISLVNTNQKRMINFLKDLIGKLLVNKDYKDKYNNNKLWIYLDNAQFHKGEEITNYMKTTKFNILYGVPYTPMYNPIETIFSIVKGKFKGQIFQHE